MGQFSHPWLRIPMLGMALWVALIEIKIKVIKVSAQFHDPSFKSNTNHIGQTLSRGNFEISEKVQKSLTTPLPAGLLPTGRQAVPTEGGAGRDYEAITRIINELKNKEKSVESFIGGRLSEKVCLK